MNKELIVNVTPSSTEIALLEDKVLVELHHEELNNNFAVGDIFVGKVKKTVPGLNAAFVDIGFDKDAFLHYTDLNPQILTLKDCVSQAIMGNTPTTLNNFPLKPDIDKGGKVNEVLNKRDFILVQILKEPISTKGPRLSCEVTLAGRYVVLAPFGKNVSVSRKINQKEEQKRLKRLVEGIKPTNFGIIVRTAAEGKKVADIHEDIKDLLDKWYRLLGQLKNLKGPIKVLSEVSKASGIMRDLLNSDFTKVVVNDKALSQELKSYINSLDPKKGSIVDYHQGRAPVFDYHGVSKQIKSSFGKTVNMASGSYLIVEHTEAMHVIDVNSGYKMSSAGNQATQALTVNLEAAAEIARQLRLRDLGGIIIVDFIDIKDPEHRQMIYRRVREVMSDDRARHTVLPLSKFCLMQITRQRVRPELKISTSEVCPTCKGTGKVKATVLLIDEIENNLSYLLHEMDYSRLKLTVHPFVDAYLKRGIISVQWKWFWKFKKWVSIASKDSYFLTEYHFYDGQNDELKL